MIRVTTTHNNMTCTSRALERFVDDAFVCFMGTEKAACNSVVTK